MLSFTVTCVKCPWWPIWNVLVQCQGESFRARMKDRLWGGRITEEIRHLTILLSVMGALLREQWYRGTKWISHSPWTQSEARPTVCWTQRQDHLAHFYTFATILKGGHLYSSFRGKGVQLKRSWVTCLGSHSNCRARNKMVTPFHCLIASAICIVFQELMLQSREEGDEQYRGCFQWKSKK